MKVGDTVVMVRDTYNARVSDWLSEILDSNWVGLILGFKGGLVEVYWNEEFPCEEEYPEQLAVV